jgi:hypothetical protein
VLAVVENESEVARVERYARDGGGGRRRMPRWKRPTFSKRWRRSTEASEHVASPGAGWY